MLEGDESRYALRTEARPALVARCTRKLPGGRAVGYVGAHHISPLLERFGKVLRVKVGMGKAPPPPEHTAQATCNFTDGFGASLPLVVAKPKTELYQNLRQIDQAVLTAVLGSAGVALVLAIFLARRVGGPVAELADEARKVAADQARPIRVRGSGEIADLSRAFNTMLEDLNATRRRLAATSRVAAWREVARRVAHEVKNPLAPIRAAVETLRRLRGRDDPAFDGYFDEATRTVLDEVHRISNIVTEFTRFARLPPPRPAPLDLEEVARHVVGLHKPTGSRVGYVVRKRPPLVRADRDQIVQVLTNLVQNGLDAVKGQHDGAVSIAIDYDGVAHAAVTVHDNGPGIAPEMQARRFEPYATTKAAGTGLGLAIAQRIAIEHNGELSQVKEGRGAAFRLVLPLEGPPPTSESPSSGDVP
jgi:nitrogen fixation/metabolism regulation signal transduction histidine kinase